MIHEEFVGDFNKLRQPFFGKLVGPHFGWLGGGYGAVLIVVYRLEQQTKSK